MLTKRAMVSWIATALAMCSVVSSLPLSSAAPPHSGPSGPISFLPGSTEPAAPSAVVTSADGSAFLVYAKYQGMSADLVASRYTATGGWTAGTYIESNSTASAVFADLVADDNGNAYVAFLLQASQSDAYVARYVAGAGWQAPERLETLPGQAQRPSLAVTGDGTLFACWYQFDGAFFSTFARRFTPAAGWGPALNIEATAGDAYNDASIGVDDAGNAICVWNQDDAGALMTFANRYSAGTGWGMAGAIETNRSSTVTARISVGAGGQGLAAWTKGDSGGYHVYTNSYTPGTGWGTPRLHANTSVFLQAATPHVDSQGGALVVYSTYDGVRYNGWADRYTPGVGWGGASLFETIDGSIGNQVFKEQLSSDGAGNYMLTWAANEGPYNNVYAGWYLAGRGWAQAVGVDDTSAPAYGAVGALWPSGEGYLVWAQSTTAGESIWMARFTMPDITPPGLSLSAPAEGARALEASVVVSGSTEPGASVSANGAAASVADDGSFALRVVLVAGANLIAVTASDTWGNQATRWVNVTFDDPVRALEAQVTAAEAALDLASAQVAAAKAEVASLSAALNNTTDALLSAQGDVDMAQALLAALEASGNATQSELDAAQTSLAAAQTSVAALQVAQATLTSQLTAAGATATAAQTTANAAQATAAAQAAQVTASQAAAESAKSSAAGASTVGMLGAALGAGGLAVSALSLMRGRGGGGGGGQAKPKAQMTDVQSNPMYKETGNQGSNPLFEKKE